MSISILKNQSIKNSKKKKKNVNFSDKNEYRLIPTNKEMKKVIKGETPYIKENYSSNNNNDVTLLYPIVILLLIFSIYTIMSYSCKNIFVNSVKNEQHNEAIIIDDENDENDDNVLNKKI